MPYSFPKKSLGQHFLVDQTVVDRLLHCLQPRTGDHLVEIGPGRCALTKPLLQHLRELSAIQFDVIEFDRDLIEPLIVLQKTNPFFKVHEADALDFDFSVLKKDTHLLRIVGNLPYNISTPLLFHLLQWADSIQDMLFMLQKEVVDRLVAPPDSEHYGRLSVMMQYHSAATRLFDVPPAAFNPPPKVMSSVVYIKPHVVLPVVANDYRHFFELVKLAFNQRRKTLRNSLKTMVNDDDWAKLAISPQCRAENLSVADFVKMSNHYVHLCDR